MDQRCSKAGVTIECHRETISFLAELVKRATLTCEIARGKDGKPSMSYGRYLATCRVGNTEVNRAMVDSGWALASNRPEGDPYRLAEKQAAQLRKGLHAYEFEKPWVWSREKSKGKCECEAQ